MGKLGVLLKFAAGRQTQHLTHTLFGGHDLNKGESATNPVRQMGFQLCQVVFIVFTGPGTGLSLGKSFYMTGEILSVFVTMRPVDQEALGNALFFITGPVAQQQHYLCQFSKEF